jgi:hypothetical protein
MGISLVRAFPFRVLLLLLLLVSSGSFSFLIAQSNPTVLENQQPGTTAWQISQWANDTNKQIKGYASATSINKDESITFYVTVNPAQSYTLDVYRIGWYQGKGGRLMQRIGPIGGSQQPACPTNASTGLMECGWTPGYTLTPGAWTSGIYLVVLTNSQGYQNYINFVLRDDARVSDLLYQESVTTYQAYNNYPNDGATGKSLYDYNSFGAVTVAGTARAVKVSYDRPYSGAGDGGFLNWEVYMVHWLERLGYDVTYSTDVDTHANGQRLLSHKGFLSVGHDEYWSKPMYDAAQAARDSGVNLAFFSGNAVYWQVRFEPSTSAAVPNRVLVCYRSLTIDPVQGPTTTVNWRDPFLNRPEQLLMGIQSTAQTSSDINQTYPYVVTNSTNWVYGGTGFRDGDSGPKIVGYETDRYVSQYPSPTVVAGSYVLLSNSPVVTTKNTSDYSNSSIYQALSGAWVFAGGTISWAWGLDKAGIVDARIQQTTSNVLNRFTGALTSVPNAPSGLAATSVTPGQINLTWIDNSTNEASFVVERDVTSDFSSITSFIVPANTASFNDTNVQAGTTYYYRVKASNATGASPYSNVSNATPSTIAPVPRSYLYDDQLRNSWANWSYGGSVVLNSTASPFVGTSSISFQPTGAWGAISLHSSGTFNTAAYASISFAFKATQAGQKLGIFFNTGAAPFKKVALDAYGGPPQGAWKVYTIPLSDVGASNASVTDFTIQDWSGTTGPLFYVDEIYFAGSAPASAPNAPSGLSATAISTSQINLTWTLNSTNQTNVIVERDVTSAFSTITSFSLSATATSFSDVNLQAATTYYYRVKAINTAGNSPYSNISNAATQTLQPPNAPSGLAATAISTSQINLTWTLNSTNQTNVIVERDVTSAFSTITSFSLSATATSFNDVNLQAGTTYYYRVKAINTVGSSPYSNVSNATTSTVSAVTTSYLYDDQLRNSWANWSYTGTVVLNSTASPFVGTSSISFQPTGAWGAISLHYNTGTFNTAAYTSISFAFKATQANQKIGVFFNTGAAPFKKVSLDVYGSPPQGAWKVYTIPLSDLGAANTSVTDFTIQDFSGATGPLFYVDEIYFAGSAPTSAPNAPSGLTATAISTSQINLTWTLNSTNQTSVIVERDVTSAFSSVASFTVTASATTFSDNSLAAGTTYYYRVKAVNSVGSSPYSNVSNATTPIASSVPPSYLYDDQLRNSWANWSYAGTVVLNSTASPFVGTSCVSFQPTGTWGAISLHYGNGTFNTAGYTSISFALKATQANQKIGIFFNTGAAPFKKVSLDVYGSPPQGAWKVYTIPLSDLGASNISVTDFTIQDWSGTAGPLFYVDEMYFKGN